MNPDSQSPRCPRCSAELPSGAPPGVCPRCALLAAATPTDAGTGPHGRITPPTADEVAAAFPAFEVLGLIGVGGMGCVYKVRERASGQVLALKILPRELASDPAFVERFGREARLLSRLRHPNIVGILGHGRSGGFCHLLMEHVDGANLRQAMRAGRFTPSQALALVPSICDALQYAHSQGVLHRDIKPENILLDADGRAKIADFGIAKLADGAAGSHGDVTLTRTGARVGTPHYMAPEQVERPEAVDHRADIYSLGVVLYEMLTGELPLGRFPAPSERAALDARVDEIVFRALAKERELRQQSAGQVKQEVEGLRASPRPGPVNAHGPGPGFTRQALAIGGTLWAVAAVGLVTVTGSLRAGLDASLWMVPAIVAGAVSAWYVQRLSECRDRPGRWWLRATAAGLAMLAAVSVMVTRSRFPRVSRVEAGSWVVFASTCFAFLNAVRRGQLTLAGVLRICAVLAVLVGAAGITVRQVVRSGEPGTPLGVRNPSPSVDPAVVAALGKAGLRPSELMPDAGILTDPLSGKPLLVLGIARSNASPTSVLAASPARPDGRDVLLGDGSVQSMPEAEFWTRVALDGPRESAGIFGLWGEPTEPRRAEQALRRDPGATFVRGAAPGAVVGDLAFGWILWPLAIDLGGAVRLASEGRPELAVPPLHAALRALPWDPAREYLFASPRDGVPGTKPDFYEKTGAEHGGLLAMLAALAAKSGDAAALEWAQERGRALWKPGDDLLLCERRLDGEDDQDWEEVRMRASDVLALKPGVPRPMTVIWHSKAHPGGTRTNVVGSAWPRVVLPKEAR